MTIEQLRAAGYSVDDAAYRRLALYLQRLLDENTRINLTAIRTIELAWPLHILDSLSLWPLIEKLNAKALVDLGTGGGVPGVPLACVLPNVKFRLIDATRKKIDAVRRIIEPLELTNVELIWGRAEELARSPSMRGWADLVTARAVAKIRELLPLASGFVAARVRCAFMKSTVDLEREIAEAQSVAEVTGFTHVETTRYSLPDSHGDRAIVVYRRT